MFHDVDGLPPTPALSRRMFVSAAALATGYALAVRPVRAAAITTDAKNLLAGAVMIPTAGGEMPGYAAIPQQGGPFPVVLVVQEIFGVHEYIRDICRRLAKLGYLAVAPELYFRQGDPAPLPDIPTILKQIVSRVSDAQVMGDLDATVAWALANHGDAARLGITGFCWGGRITWLYAAHRDGLKAAVAWYGKLVGEPSPLTPRNPIDVVGDLKTPVLGLYGGADDYIPQDSVERMRASLKAAGKEAEIIVYPGAPHAFHADYRPSYREEPARDGWNHMVEWFRRHGLK